MQAKKPETLSPSHQSKGHDNESICCTECRKVHPLVSCSFPSCSLETWHDGFHLYNQACNTVTASQGVAYVNISWESHNKANEAHPSCLYSSSCGNWQCKSLLAASINIFEKKEFPHTIPLPGLNSCSAAYVAVGAASQSKVSIELYTVRQRQMCKFANIKCIWQGRSIFSVAVVFQRKDAFWNPYKFLLLSKIIENS